uniref:Cannabinoid receptor 2 n=1 Tax=Oryctolagus cuniculus TaxID=9986 RepID=G1U069_RABIT|nr:cannabinoid receptor 2 isoform X1 [Oryctolagus cuniculus]
MGQGHLLCLPNAWPPQGERDTSCYCHLTEKKGAQDFKGACAEAEGELEPAVRVADTERLCGTFGRSARPAWRPHVLTPARLRPEGKTGSWVPVALHILLLSDVVFLDAPSKCQHFPSPPTSDSNHVSGATQAWVRHSCQPLPSTSLPGPSERALQQSQRAHPMEPCGVTEAANGSTEGLDFNPMEQYMILSDPQKIAVAVLCTLLGLLSALENLAVLYLILSSHWLRRKPSYLFIGSLAVADFLASVVFACNFVNFHVFQGVDSRAVFLLKIGSVTLTFTASVGSLLLTAIDRYLCLRYPPRYKALLTRGRALVTLGVMWVLSALVSYLPLMGWTCCPSPCSELFPLIPNDYLLSWLLFIAFLFCGIICTYVHVLWKARQHVASLAGHQDQQVPGVAWMRLDVRLAKTLGLVLAVLLLCWFPVLALMVHSLVATLSKQVKKAFAFCSMLCLVNSMVNPVIYALRSGEIRSSAQRRLARWKKRLQGLGREEKEEAPRSRSSISETDRNFTLGPESGGQ